jgi:hypothetical protein
MSNADIDQGNVLVGRILGRVAIWGLEYDWVCPNPGRLSCSVGRLRGAVPAASGEGEFAAGRTSSTGFKPRDHQ